MNKNEMEVDGDETEIKIETAKTAKQMMEELWGAELNKSVEEVVHDNMHPERWA
jgi:hypothetical protein